MELVDLNDVLGKVLENLSAAVEETGGEIDYKGLPVVMGSPVSLEQIFLNLLSNSLKYRRQDAPLRVTIRAHELEKNWKIEVKDNGIGLDPRQAERIFRIFTRLNPKDAPGEGVGLAIVKTLVERHGGQVTADGVPGQGATFSVIFPRVGDGKPA